MIQGIDMTYGDHRGGRQSGSLHRAIRNRLADVRGVVVGVDFDGTLAPIRRDPDRPTMTPANERALRRVVARPDTLVAIVSGRGLADLTHRVGLDDVVLLGNHGFEVDTGSGRFVHDGAHAGRGALRRIKPLLLDCVESIPGARVEDKGYTMSVHVRNTPPELVPAVFERVSGLVADEPRLTQRTGKAVLELEPAVDWNKGAAVTWLREFVPTQWPTVYLGDDTTDETVFRTLEEPDIGIHVGEGGTAAEYRIPDHEAVAPTLTRLATTLEHGS